MLNERRLDPPRDTEVPGWIAPVLVRGLSRAPERRYPTMMALLHALAADPVLARRRRWGIAGLVLASGLVAAGGGYAMYELQARDAAICAGGAARIAEVWDPAVAGTVRAALARTGVPHAEDVAARVQERLDGYAQGWVAAHARACETHRRGEQSDALYDRRMTCLDDRRTALHALVEMFATADAAVVDRAVQAADRLPLLARCGEARALLAQSPPPEDPAVAQAVEALGPRLARSWALLQVGQYKAARAEVEPLRASFEALGHAPPLAEALHLEGLVADALGEFAASEAALVRAVATSDGAGDDDRRALALGDLARAIGLRQARAAEGLRHGELARGTVLRLADRGPAEAALETRLGEISLQQRDFPAAERHIARAIELCAEIYGERSTVFAAALDTGAALKFMRGQFPAALHEYRRVAEIYRQAYGPNHPSLGKALNNVGAVELTLFDYAAAEKTYSGVLAVLLEAHGPNHPSLAAVYSNLGQIALGQAQYPRAIADLRRSLAINEVALPADHPDLGDGWLQLGQGHLAAGEFEAAEQTFARALAVYQRAFGAGHARTTQALASLGEAQLRGGQAEAAERSFHRALAEFTGPADDPALAGPEAGLGKLRLAQGRLTEAVKLLEAALDRLERDPGAPPFEVARAEFALAEALWRVDPTQAPRSRELAGAARASLVRLGAQFAGEAAQIDAWLARLPAPVG